MIIGPSKSVTLQKKCNDVTLNLNRVKKRKELLLDGWRLEKETLTFHEDKKMFPRGAKFIACRG